MKKLISSYITILAILVLSSCTDKNIIEAPVFPPPSVEGLTAVPGNGLVTLNWNSGNQSLFNNYSLTYIPSDGQPITIPNTETSFTINGLTNNTEYTFTLVAQKVSQATTQSSDEATVVATPFEPNLSGPELASFSFIASSNPNMALEAEDRTDLSGTIDLDNNTVVFGEDIVSAYVYKEELVATFLVPNGAVVQVNGIDQVSGTTVQDFTSPVQYDITENNITRSYIVTVNKNKFATIPNDAFRAKLVDLGMPFNAQEQLETTSTIVTEYNTDGKINIDNVGISNIKGIEFFIGTKEIDAERNSFPSINLSRNVGLKNVLIGLNSSLETVKVGKLTGLEIFYINDATKLTEATIQPIINTNLGLKRLYAQGLGTGLTSINVDNLTNLQRLRINESTAKNSATSINNLLTKNPPIASDLGNLRIYKDVDGTRCGSYDATTYTCD